jgi:hypothetical protein
MLPGWELWAKVSGILHCVRNDNDVSLVVIPSERIAKQPWKEGSLVREFGSFLVRYYEARLSGFHHSVRNDKGEALGMTIGYNTYPILPYWSSAYMI